jgi:hypothetical protein
MTILLPGRLLAPETTTRTLRGGVGAILFF